MAVALGLLSKEGCFFAEEKKIMQGKQQREENGQIFDQQTLHLHWKLEIEQNLFKLHFFHTYTTYWENTKKRGNNLGYIFLIIYTPTLIVLH